MMQALSDIEANRVTEHVQRAWFGSVERDRFSITNEVELVIEHTDDDALRFGVVILDGAPRSERLRDADVAVSAIPNDIQRIVEDVLAYDAHLSFYRVPAPVDEPTVYRATLQLPDDADVKTVV